MLSRDILQTPPRIWKISVQSHFKGDTNVFKTVRFLPILAVVLGLALAVPILADSFSRHYTLRDPAKLGGTQLKAGEYRVEFDGAKLTFKKGKDVVAEAQAEWVDVKLEAPGDSFVVDNGAIVEIRIAGRKRAIKIQ